MASKKMISMMMVVCVVCRVMVGVAGREISAGEEVCDNYGRHYTQTPRDGRQQFLKER